MEQKLKPYQRLKNILTEGDPLSDNGVRNLNDILGIKEEKSISLLQRIKDFFSKIDSYIFKKKDKMWNTTPYKRKR